MSDPEIPRQEGGSASRGLFLLLVALVLGVVVLASIGRVAPTQNTAATRPPVTSTTAPASSTTTTTLATHSPAAVKVLVANGTSVSGLAGRFSGKLNAQGYDTLSPTDTLSPAKASAVYYLTGYQGDADAIAGIIGLSSGATQPFSSAVPVATTSADVVVVVGPDLASTGAGSGSAATATTGAASGTTTTTG